MTGRKGRVVRRPDGSVRYESRAEQSHTIDHINLKEKDRFMCGEKVRHWTGPLFEHQATSLEPFNMYHKWLSVEGPRSQNVFVLVSKITIL